MIDSPPNAEYTLTGETAPRGLCTTDGQVIRLGLF